MTEFEKLQAIIADVLNVSPETITPDTTFVDDLGADSLDIFQIIMGIEEDFAPLVGMLMLGNLFRESGVVKQLTETASNALMYIVVILLGTSVGASTSAEAFLNVDTLKIVVLGLVAFAFGTFGGCMLGKLMCKLSGGKINPLIGSAGVSAVPMAARVSQKVGAEADPTNFLLMHAMGPNVAGVIGTAVAAGTFMAIFGV